MPAWFTSEALWARLSIVTIWLAVLVVGIFGRQAVSDVGRGLLLAAPVSAGVQGEPLLRRGCHPPASMVKYESLPWTGCWSAPLPAFMVQTSPSSDLSRANAILVPSGDQATDAFGTRKPPLSGATSKRSDAPEAEIR